MSNYTVKLDPEEVDNLVAQSLMDSIRNYDQGWDVFDDPALEVALLSVLRYYTTQSEYDMFMRLRKNKATETISVE